MANFNIHDPVLLISVGIILLGFAFLIWAIGKLRQKAPPADSMDFLGRSPTPSPADEFFGTEPPAARTAPEPPVAAPTRSTPLAKPEPAAPAFSKEMVDRLDGMSQRLSEMQGVLQRQANAPVGVSTPLTPEAVDKLLKIIGSVTQQVDILQRS